MLVGDAVAHLAHLPELVVAVRKRGRQGGDIGHMGSEQAVAELWSSVAEIHDVVIAGIIVAAVGLAEGSQARGQADGKEAFHGETLRVLETNDIHVRGPQVKRVDVEGKRL